MSTKKTSACKHCSECIKCSNHCLAKDIPMFSMLEDAELNKISKLIINKNFEKGKVLFLEGELADTLYIINKGKVKIHKYTKEGKEQILFILSEGEFIGALNLLKSGHYEFNAEVLEDSSICILSKQNFDKILLKNPQITLKILEKIHDRLVLLEDLVQTLSTKDIEARIATLLLTLIKDFGCESEEGIILEIPLSREELGNYVGITRETISRKLTSFQDDGLIELVGSKKIIIKDLSKLKKII